MSDRKWPCWPYCSAETGIFVALWFGLLVLGERLFRDPGALWHIVAGERMLEAGAVVRMDPFGFAPEGQRWVALSWLYECFAAVLHRLGGLDAVMLATVTLLAFFYTWLARRLMQRGIHPLAAMIVTAVALLGSTFHFHARPHMVTIALMGWTFARLCDYEAGRIPLRSLFWFVPVYALWTNIHGGQLGGVVTIAATVAGWGLAKLLWRDPSLPGWRQLIVLTLLVAACAATSLVNPYGLEMPREWVALSSSPVVPKTIMEHAPLLKSGSAPNVLVPAGLYLLALIGTLPRRPRVTWLIPLLWLAAGWMRIRHGTLFSVTAAIALGEMFFEIRWVRWLTRHGSDLLRPQPAETRPAPSDKRPYLIPLALVTISFVLQVAGVQVPVVGRGAVDIHRATKHPIELLGDLRRLSEERPANRRVFDDMYYGGFLIYYAPEVKVFIDDRWEVQRDQRLVDYEDAYNHHPERIDDWAKEYDIGLALVVKDTNFEKYLSSAKDWTKVSSTPSAVLFQRHLIP